MRTCRLCLLLAASLPLSAQRYPRHILDVGLGIAMPKDDLHPFYQNAFSWSFGYGYRPIPYLQIDVGLDSSYLAADVEDYIYYPQYGPVRIRDYQFFLPYGARAVLPISRGRVELYGGAGGAYLWYRELLRQPDQWVRLECPQCGSRSGPGWYALAGGAVALDRARMFRLGGVARVYRAHTEGEPVGALPPVRTSDRWINAYATFSFHF